MGDHIPFSRTYFPLLISGIAVVLGLVFVLFVTIIRVQDIRTTTNPKTRAAECAASQEVKLNDDSSEITYSGPWSYASGGGGSTAAFNGDYHYAPGPLSATTAKQNLGASASVSFTGNKVGFVALSWSNRGNIDVYIDDKKVDSVSGYSPAAVLPVTWNSGTLSCGQHTLKVMQSDTAGANGGRVVALDFVTYQTCSLGSACETPTPTPASGESSQVDRCWGSSDGLGGRCYDCDGNGEINILDFACFRNNWQKTI